MSENYVRELLRVSIAQICQTIGYNAIQTTPLELLQDNLHKFLNEFCRDLRRHVDHYNRTDANLNDVCLTLSNLNINVNELLEYIFNVQPVTFAVDVPKFPLHKESNLNFLKPGSKEVLIRPVHIYEHLPPILPPDESIADSEINENLTVEANGKSLVLINSAGEVNVSNLVEVEGDLTLLQSSNDQNFASSSLLKREFEVNSELSDAKTFEKDNTTAFFKSKTNARLLDEDGRPTREIGSVMMTTGGFISPAIEGKLPEARVPTLIDILEGLDAPPPPAPPPPPPLPPGPSTPTQRLVSRASTGTPMRSPVLPAITKSDSEDKVPGISQLKANSNAALLESSNVTKQQGLLPSTNNLSNTSSISAAAALRLAKKHTPSQHSVLPPPLAARILKRTKKKNSLTQFSAHGKPGRSVFPSTSVNVSALCEITSDKTQRRRMKMLQKLVESAKSAAVEISNLANPSAKLKGLPSSYDAAILGTLPSGSERIQLEKLLKKQAKHRQRRWKKIEENMKATGNLEQPLHRQKILRQQLAMEEHLKPTGNLEQPLQVSIGEPNAKSILLPDEMTLINQPNTHQAPYIGKVNAKTQNISGVNISPAKIFKQNSSSLAAMGSMQGYKGIKGNMAAPQQMFGETLYGINEQPGKELSDNKPPEVKLSTEPDRNKLNIFKKISSKQKQNNKGLSPLQNAQATGQVYACNDNQVISLPPGTTITPAEPVLGSHVYAPEDNSCITVEDSKVATDANINTNKPIVSGFFDKVPSVGEQDHSIDLVNKPKKRGRKPGSKNQPKVHGINLLPGTTNLKKPKKLKLQKNIYGPQLQFPSDHILEPLNLSHTISSGSNTSQNYPLGIVSTFPMLDPNNFQLETKERKERKKTKAKCVPSLFSDSMTSPAIGFQQQQRTPIKKFTDLSFSGPTKEEVDSINRKLMRMDTVLQPAPPLLPMNMGAHKSMLLASKEISLSPTKCSNLINPSGPKVRSSQQQQRNSSSSLPLSNASLDGQLVPPVQNFSNLPSNMLSMLPLYAFPPRPGLIPTPGLFPSVLGNFPNNSSNPASNMLLQSFLPFPSLKPSNNGHLRGTGIKSNDKSENSVLMEPASGERSYCNVAPFVPDSVKLKLSSSPGGGGPNLISPKEGSFGERDVPKTPQMRQSPTVSETVRESLQQKLGSMGTPESSSVGSKSIPPTPGGVSLSTFENLLRGGSGISSSISTPSNSIGTPEILKHSNLLNSGEKPKNVTNTPTIDVGSPIEVSDDSQEAALVPIPSLTPKTRSTLPAQPFMKPPVLPPLLIDENDIFIPIANTSHTGMNQHLTMTGGNKDAKKHKKLNKLTKKNTNSTSPVTPCSSLPVSVSSSGGSGNEAGVSKLAGLSKLAGGAELLAYWDNRLAYPSKITPANVLTATVASSSFEATKKDFGPADVIGNLTVTPSFPSDIQNKHKEHKKLKKIKYGKIKKKKDKKDKTKSKEKYLEKFEKHFKEKNLEKQREKETIKKLKKEKKKEKQRSVRNSFSSSPLPLSTPVLKRSPSACVFDTGATNISNVSFMSSIPTITPSSSVVPKLTLKLGNCQSPTPFDDVKRKTAHKLISSASNTTREPSPELARISPLVTRPPKQKSNIIDSATHTIALGGVASSSGSSIGSHTTADLFGSENTKNSTFLNVNVTNTAFRLPLSSWSSGSTLTASSTLLPQQLLQSSISQHTHDESSLAVPSSEVATTSTRTAFSIQNPVSLVQETNRPSSYIDAEGNRVWICPACGKVDDGSAMIGCDGCDAWYHWVCVGIFVAPKDNEDWFCRVCIAKKKGSHGIDKKRKRNKKNK